MYAHNHISVWNKMSTPIQIEKEFILWRILKSITIEPAVFMISLSTTMENIASSQIVIDKSCKIDFPYNDTICENLVTDFKDQNSEIQKEVNIYLTFVGNFVRYYLVNTNKQNTTLVLELIFKGQCCKLCSAQKKFDRLIYLIIILKSLHKII